jgi:hypothetical protein
VRADRHYLRERAENATAVTTTVLLLGPALFLAGHLLFQLAVSGT